MKYVIIGNGTAAIGCIEGIREVDQEGTITVISQENHPAYCRPLISYYLEQKTNLEKMNYRPDDFYERMDCEVLYGQSATGLDAAAHTVQLSDGTTLPYDRLCVAAGSSPFVPPFEGLELVEKKFSFMTLDDTLALEAAITPESSVFIVGAGLIGLKCAEGLRDRVAKITVCDLADRVLSSILDAECAALMQSHLEKNGLHFLLGDSVDRFEAGTAHMKSGADVDFDVLVLAVGVRPNLSLVKDAGGQTDRGILVDDAMRTSLPDVFAAGDCTQGQDISLGSKRVLAIMPNAYMQGHAAGVNMAGGREVHDKAIPMNSIGFFGLHAMTAGSYDGEKIEEKEEGGIRRFFVKNDRLTGFILIGPTQRTGLYTSLIRNQTPLSSLDFDALRKTASSLAFSPETRRKMFGDEV